MEPRNQTPQVRTVPYGTVSVTVVIPSAQKRPPEEPKEARTIKPIQGTTALTRIVTPRPSVIR